MQWLWIGLAVYLAVGLLSLWYASQMPWELTGGDRAIIVLAWPFFWIGSILS